MINWLILQKKIDIKNNNKKTTVIQCMYLHIVQYTYIVVKYIIYMYLYKLF